MYDNSLTDRMGDWPKVRVWQNVHQHLTPALLGNSDTPIPSCDKVVTSDFPKHFFGIKWLPGTKYQELLRHKENEISLYLLGFSEAGI